MNKSFIKAEQELVKASNNLPLPIQKASEKAAEFVDSISTSRPGLIRAMRSERKRSLVKFIISLITSISLQHNGTICQIIDGWVKPKTLAELAAQSGISYHTAKRCLALLKQLGFIESTQIKRKNILGQLEVSPGLRAFTPKFWKALGLWEIFQKSMAWAKKNCKRIFKMPYKTIKNIVKNTCKKAGNIAGKVVKGMADIISERKKRVEENKKTPIIHDDTRTSKSWKEHWEEIAKKRGIKKQLSNE